MTIWAQRPTLADGAHSRAARAVARIPEHRAAAVVDIAGARLVAANALALRRLGLAGSATDCLAMSGTTVSKHFVHELVAGSPRVTARPLGLRAQPAWVWVTWAADATEPSAETTITFAAPDSPVPVKPDAGLERLRDIRGAQRSSQAVRRPAPAMPAANPVPQADRDAATLAAIRLRISEGLAGRGGLDRPEADGATTAAPPEPDGAERPDTVRQLAHELRSPLAAISALADAIATEQFGPLANARYGEYARDIQATAGHALSVVAAMLERAPAGAAMAQPTLRSNGTTVPPPPTVTFDAGAIVAAAVRTYAPLAERADMRLSAVNQLGAIAAVIGEAHVLQQVLANLITNAIQHTPAGGTIHLTTRRAPRERSGRVEIVVRDTGCGMTQSTLVSALSGDLEKQRQFSGFVDAAQRLTAGRTGPNLGGTGLGLRITDRLCSSMGWGLTIDSTPGIGTRAMISLPPSNAGPPRTSRRDTDL